MGPKTVTHLPQVTLGHRLRDKTLTVLDEYTRECLAIKVERSLDSQAVLEVLAPILSSRVALKMGAGQCEYWALVPSMISCSGRPAGRCRGA